MGDLDFRIAIDAVDYLRRSLLYTASGELLVLTIAPQSSHQKSFDIGGRDPTFSNRELTALANDYLASLSSPAGFHWVIGGMRKSRLAGESLVVIDGIECFFPDEVKSVLNGHVLRLRGGELVFDPDLEPPPSVSLPRRVDPQ